MRKLKNVQLIPYLINNNIFCGGVNSDDRLAKIERKNNQFASFWDDKSPFLSEEVKHIKGSYLFAGPLFNHFGHVMTESIHRLYAYDDSEHAGIIFSSAAFSYKSAKSSSIPSYLEEVFKIFNIPSEKVILCREHLIVDELHFVEPGSRLQNGPEAWYLDILEKKKPSNSSVNGNDKIILGRSHIVEKGTILGESYFVDLLIKGGFTYIAPELLSIKDQISIMCNAKEVVFVEGSSIYSMELLSKVGAKIHFIPRRPFDSFFRPHLEGKSQFSLIGELSQNIRLPNKSGVIRPDSPTIVESPIDIFTYLLNNKLINDGLFELDVFLSYVKYDLIRYCQGNKNIYNSILNSIEKSYSVKL